MLFASVRHFQILKSAAHLSVQLFLLMEAILLVTLVFLWMLSTFLCFEIHNYVLLKSLKFYIAKCFDQKGLRRHNLSFSKLLSKKNFIKYWSSIIHLLKVQNILCSSHFLILHSNPGCQILSKACVTSRNTNIFLRRD